jgi:hypothetical protein
VSDNSHIGATVETDRGVVIHLPPSWQCFDAHFPYYQSMSDYLNFRSSESTPVPINLDNRRSTVEVFKNASIHDQLFCVSATLRSGYMLQDSAEFAQTVEELMRETMGIPKDEAVR